MSKLKDRLAQMSAADAKTAADEEAQRRQRESAAPPPPAPVAPVTSYVSGATSRPPTLMSGAPSRAIPSRTVGVRIGETDEEEVSVMVARCTRLGIRVRRSSHFSHFVRAGLRALHDLDDAAFVRAMDTGRPVARGAAQTAESDE